MSDIAIRACGISKRYVIGQLRGGRTMLRDEVGDVVRALVRRDRVPKRDVFWALQDVSFEVEEGAVVGLIGRNGAGKTTLLRILSRITEPSAGYVDLRGRTASLLEVGTGFHPELTGRENVYLNGSILGMTRREISSKFDEIIAFAGVERFVDTPVKRYSSGMYVRLAFSVAAFLDPDILIIDEVLSVGDAAFQRRSLGKIEDVARSGRTVLFVSHSMQSVRSLCDRAILLEAGRVVADGDTESIVRQYLENEAGPGGFRRWEDPAERPGDDQCRLVEVRVEDDGENVVTAVGSSEPLTVVMVVELASLHPALAVGFDLLASDGSCAFRSFQTDAPEESQPRLEPGVLELRCKIPGGLLNTGRFTISPRIGLHYIKWIAQVDSAVQFDVFYDHGGSEFLNAAARPGVIAPVLDWTASSRSFV